MDWWTKKREPAAGSVLFPGAIAPSIGDLAGLERAGVELTTEATPQDAVWSLRARHPEWGAASIRSLRVGAPPDVLIEHDPRLTAAEKASARRGKSSISVVLDAQGGSVLRERKQLLRYLHAAADGDAVAVVDHTAQAFWSPAELAEELAHDADLDILSLFTVHALTRDDGSPFWMHSHGFAELGFHEFDVLDPSPQIVEAWEVIRAIAFAIVEGTASVGGNAVELAGGAPLQLVDARTYRARATGRHPDWEQSVDEMHLDRHAVVCDPPVKRLFGLLGSSMRPWSLLSKSSFDDVPIYFSAAASELTAARARATWDVFRASREELADLELPALVKLRFATGDAGTEHLWFEVDGCTERSVHATLVNEPWADIGMAQGDRREHDLERLSDWTIMTPVGQLTPRSLMKLRVLRENREEIVKLMREHGAGG